MAFTHGKDSAFAVDDTGGTLRTLSQYVDNVSGLPGSRDLSEVTAFGDEGVKNIPGLVNATFSISGHFDSTVTTGPDAVLGALMTGQSATATFEYGPEGNTSGKVKYSGEAWITSYTAESSVSDKVSFSAEFQVDGVVTRGTYA
ncbi:hypothetical protein [Nonomuraea gerenzanensis]|uniref:Phage major tail protein n=1 Tax=Nonomuraea gerenzanensis TaxID=93944 RepID=A0A1M4EMQ5_9ACTN|nr:hypothetical protein [Nonomuraea gerenzanensis]UBU11602.1 hypothetical protein LCN96_46070 [Nonomuraea gerenzanensis]SBP00098.1 hypothetical protein BN4615_P9614 [Nonomuraea gerenzanensis]